MQAQRLSDFSKQRSNNLNFLKFIASLLVIISHAYPLSKGSGCKDFLLNISNNSLGLGGLAVAIFFISSGFFVTKSVEYTKGKDYLKKRIKRIFPPLWFVLIVIILIVSVFFTKFNFFDFYFSKAFILYCLNFVLIPVHRLPGVFLDNAYPNVINGALWTLPIEFICYLILYFLFKIKKIDKKSYFVFFLFMVVAFFCVNFLPIRIFTILKGYIPPLFMFFLGSFFWVYRENIKLDVKYFIFSLVCFFVLIVLHLGQISLFFFLPYILLYLSFSKYQVKDGLSKLGNYSYGIYLFGWPIQQMIVSSFGGSMSILLNCLLALPISVFGGILVYELVEKNIK